MKIITIFKRGFTLIEVMWAILIIAILTAMFLPATIKVKAASPGTTPYQPNYFAMVSNYTGLTVGSNNVPILFGPSTNQSITIKQNQGSGWLISITTTNNSVGNLTIGFDVNADSVANHWTGTNAPHYTNWTLALPNNGTAIYALNFSREAINNFRNIFPTAATNSCITNGIKIDFLMETHGNQ